MFTEESDPASLPNSTFVEFVRKRALSAKQHGATHALLVHMVNAMIVNYVVLGIDDVGVAYAKQIEGWPSRSRNTKTPTLYFEDARDTAEAACVSCVLKLEVSLDSIANSNTEMKVVTASSTAASKR